MNKKIMWIALLGLFYSSHMLTAASSNQKQKKGRKSSWPSLRSKGNTFFPDQTKALTRQPLTTLPHPMTKTFASAAAGVIAGKPTTTQQKRIGTPTPTTTKKETTHGVTMPEHYILDPKAQVNFLPEGGFTITTESDEETTPTASPHSGTSTSDDSIIAEADDFIIGDLIAESDSEDEVYTQPKKQTTAPKKVHPHNPNACTQVEFYDNRGYVATTDLATGNIVKMRTDHQTTPHTLVDFTQRVVQPVVEEKSEAKERYKKDIKLPLYIALLQKQSGNKTAQSLGALLTALTGKKIEEANAVKYFEENRDVLLHNNLTTLPKLILPETPSEDASPEDKQKYYNGLQQERERTRAVKNELYNAATQLAGEPKTLQQKKADAFSAQRKKLLEAIYQHETQHGLPSTKSWTDSVGSVLSLW